MEKSLNWSIGNTAKKVSLITYTNYIGRFILTSAVLVSAFIFSDIFGPFGTITGVSSLQLSAFAAHILLKKYKWDDI